MNIYVPVMTKDAGREKHGGEYTHEGGGPAYVTIETGLGEALERSRRNVD